MWEVVRLVLPGHNFYKEDFWLAKNDFTNFFSGFYCKLPVKTEENLGSANKVAAASRDFFFLAPPEA